MRDVNYKAETFETPHDEDLLEAELTFGVSLPWLLRLLEELQGLRDNLLLSDVASGVGLAEDLHLRVEYLEGILNKIGARYEEKTPLEE